MGMVRDWFKPLDQPIEATMETSWIKKGKYRFVIHYEDGFHKDYFKKVKNDYHVTIKKHTYMIRSESIIYGKQPELHYYFNNPMPITYKFETSKIKTLDLNSPKKIEEMKKKMPEMVEQLAKVYIDGRSLDAILSNNLINKMYGSDGITGKQILIIILVSLVVVGIVTLVILQATGKIDIRTMFKGGNNALMIGGGWLWNKIKNYQKNK